MAYETEREAFRQLKSDAPGDALDQFVRALNGLHDRLDTADGGQRFLFGYAVEMCVAGLFNAANVPAKWVGAGQGRPDLILVESEAPISIKSSATKGRSANIRLVNKLGRGARAWDVATIFVFARTGIIYADPETLPEDAIVSGVDDDATVVRRKLVEDAVAAEYRIAIDLPIKPPSSKQRISRPMTDFALRALDEIGLTDMAQWVKQAIEP